jgi:phosphopantetheinyl transferase
MQLILFNSQSISGEVFRKVLEGRKNNIVCKSEQSRFALFVLEEAVHKYTGNYYQVAKNDFGAPYFPQRLDLFCSVSHSYDVVCGIVSDIAIGIDVEKVREHESDLLAYISTKSERNLFKERSEMDITTSIFVIKESIMKLLNVGLGIPFADLEIVKKIRNNVTTRYHSYYFSTILMQLSSSLVAISFPDKNVCVRHGVQ